MSVISIYSCTTIENLVGTLDLFPNKNPSPTQLQGTTISIKNYEENYIDISKYRTGVPEKIAKELVLKYPSKNIKSDQELLKIVTELIQSSSDDIFIQVKSIHDWVALSIAYDVASFLKGELPDQSVFSVLERGNAVCEGYANVFEKMCILAKIKVQKVSGYARGYGSDSSVIENPNESNHAWNIVNIKNYWYSIDTTWDSGYLNNGKFIKNYSTAYFLLKSEFMIYTHYPQYSYLQLMEKPVSSSQFVLLPFLDGLFFDVIKKGYLTLEKTLYIDSLASIVFEVDSRFKYSVSLFDSKSNKEYFNVFSDLSGSNLTIFFAPPIGSYTVRLYSNPTGSFTQIAEFNLKSKNEIAILTPTIFGDYISSNSRLISPIMKTLKQGNEVEIKIKVPKASKVIIVINGIIKELEKNEDDIYSTIITIPSTKKIEIFALIGISKSLVGLISIPVQ